MKTLRKSLNLIFLLGTLWVSAQNISFDHLNSNNVLQLMTLNNAGFSESKISGSETQIMQYGNGNFAEIAINPFSKISAAQNGDYNYLNFDNSFTQDKAKIGISTEGNNNIIDITGSNSISEKMQINLKGSNMTIFMRNY